MEEDKKSPRLPTLIEKELSRCEFLGSGWREEYIKTVTQFAENRHRISAESAIDYSAYLCRKLAISNLALFHLVQTVRGGSLDPFFAEELQSSIRRVQKLVLTQTHFLFSLLSNPEEEKREESKTAE